MRDVAAGADVSLKTVSRYVNGATNIHPDLVIRIADSIDRLGYRHNLAAASLRPGRTSKVLGLVICDLANPYYAGLAAAVERVAAAAGYLLFTASSDEDRQRHRQLIDRMIDQRVEGLVVVPPADDDGRWVTGATPHVPVVVVDRGVDAAVPTVVADDCGGAQAATTALIGHDARRVAFVGDTLQLSTMRERLRGHRTALVAAGIDPDPLPVCTTAHTAEQAADAVLELVEHDAADAVFAANNRGATGAVLGFGRAGRRLPLIGFDDFEAATLLHPAVSVVSHDIAAMGEAAAGVVLAAVGGTAGAPTTQVLPTRLVLRGSELPDRPI